MRFISESYCYNSVGQYILLKVRAIVTDIVSRRVIRAGIELGSILASLDATAQLGRRFPHQLREMASILRKTRVIVVVVLSFVVPGSNGRSPVGIPHCQVFAIRALFAICHRYPNPLKSETLLTPECWNLQPLDQC